MAVSTLGYVVENCRASSLHPDDLRMFANLLKTLRELRVDTATQQLAGSKAGIVHSALYLVLDDAEKALRQMADMQDSESDDVDPPNPVWGVAEDAYRLGVQDMRERVNVAALPLISGPSETRMATRQLDRAAAELVGGSWRRLREYPFQSHVLEVPDLSVDTVTEASDDPVDGES